MYTHIHTHANIIHVNKLKRTSTYIYIYNIIQSTEPERLIFSIDPIGCQDVDDALSATHLSNGMIELGVHIADVSYFVRHNSLIDIEACSRGIHYKYTYLRTRMCE